MQRVAVRCCVAGGGPAGVMTGLLLARAGVDVVVLEKHADFFRDFRGDTIHPSTLELMHELGSLDDLLKLPHQEAHRMAFQFGDLKGVVADFDRAKLRYPLAIMHLTIPDYFDILAACPVSSQAAISPSSK
jgi:2-polyprenyl-6-methoxyphenol hydroxylase-like FAD-dependent oxidoreductase